MQVLGRRPRVVPQGRVVVANHLGLVRVVVDDVAEPAAAPVRERPRENELEVTPVPWGQLVDDAERPGPQPWKPLEDLLLAHRTGRR